MIGGMDGYTETYRENSTYKSIKLKHGGRNLVSWTCYTVIRWKYILEYGLILWTGVEYMDYGWRLPLYILTHHWLIAMQCPHIMIPWTKLTPLGLPLSNYWSNLGRVSLWTDCCVSYCLRLRLINAILPFSSALPTWTELVPVEWLLSFCHCSVYCYF